MTTTTRTFASLNDGDSFRFTADASDAEVTKITWPDGRTFYRGNGGTNVPMTEDCEVYHVRTEADRSAAYDAQRAKEKDEQRNRAMIFRADAGAVAKALGKGWKLLPADAEQSCESRVAIDGPDSERIVMRTDGYDSRGRIRIYGTTPDRAMRYSSSEITVARDKDPAAIARDITRRLLPAYRKIAAEAKEKHAQENAYKATCEATKATLVKAGGETLAHSEERVWFQGGEAQVSGECARLTIHSVPAKLAARIIALVLSNKDA
jgi:hypothetical protein